MENVKKAYEIIYQTRYKDAFAGLMIKELDDSYNPALITELVYGTLRNYYLVRENWRRFTKTKLSQQISSLLDLGIYMIIYSDKPDYAVVNNIVEISKKIKKKKYTKLVNAVLNEFIRQGPLKFDEDDITQLSIKYSNPLWLTNLWNAHYGLDRTKEILKYNLTRNTLTLRVNPHKISRDQLLALDSNFKAGSLAPEEIYYEGNIFQTDYFKDGLVSWQDAASQLVAHAVTFIDTDKVLDACSAPGTKATHIASLRHDKGHIDAVELYESRSNLIRNSLARLDLSSISVYNHDARFLEEILEVNDYDHVLLDVPCTGFGVMRGKAEIKINTKPEDIDSIVKLQEEIIDSALPMLKVGGNLIYSTCTLNKKENENQVARILRLNPNFELVSEETIFGYEHQSDSFYLAVLKKLN